MKKDIYEKLTNRNFPIISRRTQKKIFNCRIVLAGCGLGANIGVLAARTGFRNFFLIDGDNVELSNINRQPYDLSEIGKKKALILKKKIQLINPRASCEIIDKHISSSDLKKIVFTRNSVLVNMLDFEKVFISLSTKALNSNCLTLIPFNVSFGSLVFSFRSVKRFQSFINKIVSGNERIDNKQLYEKLFFLLKDDVNKSLREEVGKQLKREDASSQVGIAANITSSLVLKAILDHLMNKKLKKVEPQIIINNV